MEPTIEKESVSIETTPEVKKIKTIIWDLETTGFVAPECKLLEIGAFVIYEDYEIETKHWVLDNKVIIPEKIIEITGITLDIIAAEGRDPVECVTEFLEYIQAADLNVTHNGIKFDIPFLLGTVGDVLKWTPEQLKELETTLRNRAFDTAACFKGDRLKQKPRDGEMFCTYADRVMNQRVFGLKFNLGLCCDHYKIDRTNIIQHRALGDVALTYELFKKLNPVQEQAPLGRSGEL